MNKEQKENLIKIILVLFLVLIIYIFSKLVSKELNEIWAMFLVPYFLISYDIFIEIFNKIKEKENIFDEDFLMALASLGAFVLGEYLESVIVITLYKIGELFEDYAVDKSIDNIKSLMDIRPDYANILVDNKLKRVDPIDINVNDLIYVLPGEKVPLDGIVESIILEDKFFLDKSSLTGESKLEEGNIGNIILSGSINVTGNNLDILKQKEEGNLNLIKGTIVIRVTNSFKESTVSKILDLIENSNESKSNNEAFITKFAKVYTPVVCILALMISSIYLFTKDFSWIYRGLTFLVISCPCALVISIPLAFFSAIGACSKKGILVKGSVYIEKLAKVSKIAFDKTGTLTKGNVLKEDVIKEEAKAAIELLKKLGIRYTIMLTGDKKEIAIKIKDEINLDDFKAELLPDEKVNYVKALLDKKETLMYIGDGINDAPSLITADIGCAMGRLGTDASIYASDVVIMDDNLLKIPKGIKISRKCLRIVKENIIFSIFVKLICMILSSFGIFSMWISALADVGVMLICVINSLRALK